MKEFKFFSKNKPDIFSENRNPPIANLHAYHARLYNSVNDGDYILSNLISNGIEAGELTTYQSIRQYYSTYYSEPIIPAEDHERYIGMVEYAARIREQPETNSVWRGDIVELEEMGVLDDDE
jgi:hypothetical protein